MSEGIPSRRFVALVAAYVVALQALLLPLSVAAGASLNGSICAAASTENSQPPASHDVGCPCAAGCGMQCCAQALNPPPQIAVALALTRTRAPTLAPAIEPAVRPMTKGPQNPRAPPV